MKDARLYKEAGEHETSLSFRDDGVYIAPYGSNEWKRLVSISPEGIKPYVDESWEADFARRVARMIRYETLSPEEKAARKAARSSKATTK